MKRFLNILCWFFRRLCDTKGCTDIHIKKVQAKGKSMKKQKHNHTIKNKYKKNNKNAKEIIIHSFLLYLKQKCDTI